MGKQQTRRSISVKGLTYQRLKDYCDKNSLTVSGFLETVIGEKLDALGVLRPTVLRTKAPPRPMLAAEIDQNKEINDKIISQHFTF